MASIPHEKRLYIDKKKFIAGGLSGIVEISLTYPIDYIKVRRQEYLQKSLSMKNFYKDIAPNGFKSYYTGYLPRVIGIIPMRITFWGSHDTTKSFLEYHDINTPYNFLIIGMSGGFFQTVVDNQIEIVKFSKITNRPKNEMINALMKFQGFNASLIRNVCFNTCVSYLCFNNTEDKSPFEKVLSGAFGGLIGSVLTQPLDYVKSFKHRTNDNRAVFKILKETAIENPRKLYAGGLFRCIANCSTMGIGFFTFDFIKKHL